jgi:hypothetical protein
MTTPALATFGAKVTATGIASTRRAGATVGVFAHQCGDPTAQKITTVQTQAGGRYSVSLQPLLNTVYSTEVSGSRSAGRAVRVRPRLTLRRLGPRRYSLRVDASASFAGKVASFQRYAAARRRWVAVRAVKITTSSGVVPAVASRVSFRSAIRAGVRVRATLAKRQVGACYAAGLSNTIRS